MKKNALIKGTFILTVTGFSTRLIGFLFRIFTGRYFGEEQLGLYQLVFPVFALCYSFSSAGIESALSRSVAVKISHGKKREADLLLYLSLTLSLILSFVLMLVLKYSSNFIATILLDEPRCQELLTFIADAIPFASVHSCICGYYLGMRKTKVPAFSQLLEQCVRVGSMFLFFVLYKLLST